MLQKYLRRAGIQLVYIVTISWKPVCIKVLFKHLWGI